MTNHPGLNLIMVNWLNNFMNHTGLITKILLTKLKENIYYKLGTIEKLIY